MFNKKYKSLPVIIWIFLALFLVRAFIYMSFVPPWQGPDEPQHYDYVHYLQTEKKLPVLGEVIICSKVRRSLDSFYFKKYLREQSIYAEGIPVNTTEKITKTIKHDDSQKKANKFQTNQIIQHPPLYYMLGALLTWPFKDGSLFNSILLLRFMGALLGAGIVLLTYFTVSLIFDKNPYPAYGATVFIAINPMFTHITTRVNNDTLTNFLFALFLYFFIKSIKKGFSIKRATTIGMLIGVGLLTKIFFGLALIMLILAFFLFRDVFFSSYKEPLIATGLPLIISSPWYFRNFILYKKIQPVFKFHLIKNSFLQNISFKGFLTQTDFLRKFIISFWSNFGWIKPRFTGIYYKIITIIVAIALIGLVVYLVKLLIKKDYFNFKIIGLLLLAVMVLFFTVAITSFSGAKTTGIVEGVQGRYFFFLIGVIGLLLYLGLEQILPFKKGYSALLFLTFSLIILDISAIFFYILPFFYF